MLLSHPAEPWMTLPELMLIEFALCGCKSESQPTKHAEPPPDANCNGNWRGADDNIDRPTCAAFVGHGGDKLERNGCDGLANAITICICLSVCVCGSSVE